MPFTWQVSLSLKRSTTSVAAKAAKNWFQKDFVCKRRGNATLLSESSLIFFNPHECPSGCVCDRDAILFTCSASFRTLQLILQLCQWVEEPPGHCAFKILGPRLVWIARLITEVVCSFLKSCLICTFFFFSRRTSWWSALHFQTTRLQFGCWLTWGVTAPYGASDGLRPLVRPANPIAFFYSVTWKQSSCTPQIVTWDIYFYCVFRHLLLFTNTLFQSQQGQLKILLPPAYYLSSLPKTTDPIDLKIE